MSLLATAFIDMVPTSRFLLTDRPGDGDHYGAIPNSLLSSRGLIASNNAGSSEHQLPLEIYGVNHGR